MADKKFIIEVRSKGFGKSTREIKRLEKSTKQYDKTTGQLRGRTQGLIRGIGSIRNSFLLYTFAIGAATKATSVFISSASKFQDVKARLVGLMGGVLDAERAFQKFNTVAAKTPFTLDDVVNAGAQLKAFGADAEALLGPITDLAAFMGTSATEAANAFGRAYAGGAGAADIFREKGILNIIKDFEGIENLTDMTLPQFREAMVKTFTDPSTGIAGSTERLSKTFTGAMSNMGDSLSRLAAEIGDVFLPAMTRATKRITDNADRLREWLVLTKQGRQDYQTFGEELDVFASKVRGNKDIDDLTRQLNTFKEELRNVQEPLEATKKALSDGDIVSISMIPPEIQEEFKTFTILADDQRTSIDQVANGMIILSPLVENLTDVYDKASAAQETTGVGTLSITQKIALLENQIKALNAEEIKRLDILSDIDTEEVMRKERILALSELEKMRQSEIAHTNQLMDDQIAKMENAAMASAGMRTDIENVSNSSISGAASINILAGAMQGLRSGTADANQMFGIFLRTVGTIIALTPGGAATGGLMNLASSFFAHTGGLIKDNGIQRFATGGMVQGKDNVPIMAQAGEFIMRREAVQNIGVQNLADMNRSGESGNVTVNISAPLVDDTVIDHIIPAINKAMNRNLA